MANLTMLAWVISPYTALIPGIWMGYKIYKQRKPIYLNPLNMGLFGLLIWGIFSGTVNDDLTSIMGAMIILLYLFFCIYTQNTFSDTKFINVAETLWGFSLVSGVAGILEKALSYFVSMDWISSFFWSPKYVPDPTMHRIYSTFGNPNVAGDWFAAMILVSLFFYQKSGKQKKYLLGVLLFVISLILTGSKGALVAAEIGILSYSFLQKNKKAKLLAAFVILFGVCILCFCPELQHFNSRTGIWQKSISYFLDSPVCGVGIMGMLKNIGDIHAHNLWISIAVMFGVGGFSSYLFLQGYLIRSLFLMGKHKEPFMALLASIQILLLVHGLVDFTIMTPQGGILFFGSAACISSIARRYNPYEQLRTEMLPLPQFEKRLRAFSTNRM